MTDDVETWNEEASDIFVRFGDSFVPWRGDIADAILRLLPVSEAEQFTIVELGVGTGWLTEAVVSHFTGARALALDGSPRMLQETAGRLKKYQERLELRPFRLQESSWIDSLPLPVRAFVSCLAVHHLDGNAKRDLYRRLFERLEPGGALLFADVIAPASAQEARYYEWCYERDVREHSLARTGSLSDFESFLELEWNLFRYPDPVDKPSMLTEHLGWLDEAGYEGVDVFWSRSGHALYGGYKPT